MLFLNALIDKFPVHSGVPSDMTCDLISHFEYRQIGEKYVQNHQ